MCGRYAAAKDQGDLVLEFDVELVATDGPSRSVLAHPQDPPAGTPDFNVAPSKQAPVVLTRAPRGQARAAEVAGQPAGPAPVRQLRLLTWGLVPSWAKDPKIGMRFINARAETVLDKGPFSRAAHSRRCLVPADGWFEWQASPTVVDARGKPRKQPFFIHREDGVPVAFAGLYEFWRDPNVADPDDPLAWLTTFTIVTTAADPGLDRIHDRQPLVLDPDDWSGWLDPAVTDPHRVSQWLGFARPGRFAAHPVSTAVNSSSGKGPGLIEPLPVELLRGAVDPSTGEVIGQ
ncbi:MAG: SOS response-associated peptidase [Candidatus Phosphoribacter sp.]